MRDYMVVILKSPTGGTSSLVEGVVELLEGDDAVAVGVEPPHQSVLLVVREEDVHAINKAVRDCAYDLRPFENSSNESTPLPSLSSLARSAIA